MNACVYICFNCPTCERVVDIVNSDFPEVKVINVQVEKPKIQRIQIFPALFIEGRLIAYGDDIIDKLRA